MHAREPKPIGVDLSHLYSGKKAVSDRRAEISTRAFDEALTGQPRVEGGVLLDPPGKETSPEVASIAARYVNIQAVELTGLDGDGAALVAYDLRRLAASALTQAKRTKP